MLPNGCQLPYLHATWPACEPSRRTLITPIIAQSRRAALLAFESSASPSASGRENSDSVANPRGLTSTTVPSANRRAHDPGRGCRGPCPLAPRLTDARSAQPPATPSKGGHVEAVELGALATFGRQPRLPSARHVLRGLPPREPGRACPAAGLVERRVARLRGAGGGSVCFLRSKNMVPASNPTLDLVPISFGLRSGGRKRSARTLRLHARPAQAQFSTVSLWRASPRRDEHRSSHARSSGYQLAAVARTLNPLDRTSHARRYAGRSPCRPTRAHALRSDGRPRMA